MKPHSIWPTLLGISEDEWERTTDGFSAIAKQIAETNRAWQLRAAEMHRQFLESEQRFRDSLKRHRPVFERLKELADSPERIIDSLDVLMSDTHQRMLKYGYFISLSSASIPMMSGLLEVLDEEDPEAVREALCGILTKKENTDHLAERWQRNPFLERRTRFLVRGLEAHHEGDYIVSIPVLLPHIEGILADFFVETGLYCDLPKKFQGNDAVSRLKAITVEEIAIGIDTKGFATFVEKQRIYEFVSDEDRFLNRGKILHGLSLNYDREDWSAKLVYLIDFLCEFTSQDWIAEPDSNGRKFLKQAGRSFT